jgi:acetolactate decarboxylase
MHDSVLHRVRETFHLRHRHAESGSVDQVRSAGRLFAGDYSAATTAGEEFGGSRIGLGVMHELDGEVISVRGFTWRVPVDGVPVEVGAQEGIAFGVAAHGGREHTFDLSPGLDLDGILAAIDAYLERTHIDHEQVVCAIEVVGDFTDMLLRTVAPPTHEGETLGEIIEDEIRFSFDTWHGTLVGFRFPDATQGQTIPSLHLHGISSDATSGGHVRQVTTGIVRASIWVDELHPIHDVAMVEVAGQQATDDVSVDFARYEGPVND